MKTAVLHKIGKPRRIEDMPIPTILLKHARGDLSHRSAHPRRADIRFEVGSLCGNGSQDARIELSDLREVMRL